MALPDGLFLTDPITSAAIAPALLREREMGVL